MFICGLKRELSIRQISPSIMINVTKTFLPPILEYNSYLERVWKNQWLTNRGELVIELEEKLKFFLNTNSILLGILVHVTVALTMDLCALWRSGLF